MRKEKDAKGKGCERKRDKDAKWKDKDAKRKDKAAIATWLRPMNVGDECFVMKSVLN